MALNLHISVSDQSDLAQVVQRLAAAEHISTDEAATQLLTEAAKLHRNRTPAEEMLGAFSSPEDLALMDEVMKVVHARREADLPKDFGF